MKTLSTFDLADFEDHAPEFSSLVYLIDLVRVGRSVKRLLAAQSSANEREGTHRSPSAVFRADALLVNWKLRLPPEKQRSVTKTGEVDDIMLQSHLLFHSLRAFVHACDGDTGTNLIHARARRDAFEGAVNLIILHPSFLGSSPLNIKPLSRCAMAGLSVDVTVKPRMCAVVRPTPIELQAQMQVDSDGDFSRENLRLALGALKQTSKVWKLAQTESDHLKALARKYYSPHPPAPPPPPLAQPPFTTHRPSQPPMPALSPGTGTAGRKIGAAMRENAYSPDPIPLAPSAVLEDQDQDHQLQKSRETRDDDLFGFDGIISLESENLCHTMGIDGDIFSSLQFQHTLAGLGRSGNVDY